MRGDYGLSTGDHASSFIGAMYATCLEAGIPIISFNKCCRLCAWVLVFGGGNEMMIYNAKMRNSVLYAQRRLNILGGEIPDKDCIAPIKQYVKDCEAWRDRMSNDGKPAWIAELETEFNVVTRA